MIVYEYHNEVGTKILTFCNELCGQPDYIKFNETQEIGIIATDMDILWVNIQKSEEVDLDEVY